MPSDIYFIDDASINTYKDIENALGGYWKTALTTADERRKYWWEGGLVTNAGYTRTLPVKTGQHIIITNNTSHSCQYVLLREALWDTGVGNPLNGTPIKYLNTSNITLRVDDFYVPDGYNYLTILSNQNSAPLDNRWPTSRTALKTVENQLKLKPLLKRIKIELTQSGLPHLYKLIAMVGKFPIHYSN